MKTLRQKLLLSWANKKYFIKIELIYEETYR